MHGVTARGTEEIPQAEWVKQLSEGWCGWGGRDGVKNGGMGGSIMLEGACEEAI